VAPKASYTRLGFNLGCQEGILAGHIRGVMATLEKPFR